MHHIVLERWSRGASPLHRRDPRAKILALLAFLVVLATSERALPQLAGCLFLFVCAALVWARIPVLAAMARAAVALPFAATFAAASWLSGDPAHGAALAVKSYLSALAVLAVVATTPLAVLLRGLETMRVPRILLTVTQFLYRYLFVISEEAQHMSKAAAARGAVRGRLTFRAAAGALAVLFARSYGRAREIHGAMLARGYSGSLPTAAALRFNAADAGFLAIALLLPTLARFALDRFA